MEFTKFYGNDSLIEHCKKETRCNPYSGQGISYRKEYDTCILRSVDNTYYYSDNLDDIENIEYTLFGHNGDQDPDEKRYNKPLINCEHIYLYRVSYSRNNKPFWTWYGKYTITNRFQKNNIGKDGEMRQIIVLNLKRMAP